MSERRFTDKAELDPASVWALDERHPAMVENRTLFPSTVAVPSVGMPTGILVSGRNNRKLGAVVEKGVLRGHHLYSLTLEERATCPDDCSERAICYGNGMQFARRNRIDDDGLFYRTLAGEISDILREPIPGLLVRLHVLGDFPSVPYVGFWSDMLDMHQRLKCYGYTHRRTSNWGGDEIGDAIQDLKDRHPDRFRIRWSSPAPRPDGAVVISRTPDRPRVDEGLVCPAQTSATECCATCGLCWEDAVRNETIVFVKHGPKSKTVAAENAMSAARAASPGLGASKPDPSEPGISEPDTPQNEAPSPIARDNPREAQFESDLVAAMPSLKAYCISLTGDRTRAEDLVQETVMRALAARASFDGGNINAWLTTIAKNHFRSAYRKSRREVEDPDGLISLRVTSNDDAETALAAKQALDRFENLPEHVREPMRGAAMGRSYEAMAAEHNIPEGTIKSRISRGRDRLRAAIETPTPAGTRHSPAPTTPSMQSTASSKETIEDLAGTRAVMAIPMPSSITPADVSPRPPDVKFVDPRVLRIEESYQRSLSAKSIAMIRRIVENWSWAKFKPPICVETRSGLFVIDGQHTSIAAATHPSIRSIPILVVEAGTVSERAESFVAHNRDRLAMSAFQIFHGEVVAGVPEAAGVMAVVARAGASIPRNPTGRKFAKPGQIVPLQQTRTIYRTDGPEALETMLTIAVKAGLTPISRTTLRAIRMILREPQFAHMAACGVDTLAAAIAAIPNIDLAAENAAVALGQTRDRACVSLIEKSLDATRPTNNREPFHEPEPA